MVIFASGSFFKTRYFERNSSMMYSEMPASCRPQEKLMYAGAGALSDSELLALVIRTGTGDKSAVQLAEEVDKKRNAYKEGYRTLCDVGRQRIRLVAERLQDSADCGFKAYKIAGGADR